MMRTEILEVALLLILLLTALRTNLATDLWLVVILAVLFFVFLGFSFRQSLEKKEYFAIRFSCALAILLILSGFLLSLHVERRFQLFDYSFHDGVVLIESATEAILRGQNPYEINFREAFGYVFNKPFDIVYNHYMYSPMTFLANVPFKIVLGNFFNFYDFRITLVIFLILAAFMGTYLVEKKILFLIIFLLNPLFLQLTLYGANEVLILLFIFICLAFLKYRKVNLATVMLAFATGTKLLVLPFVPLYFMYLYLTQNSKPKTQKFVLKQLVLFILVNLGVYLPFAIWSLPDLVGDVLFYHLRGGVESHVIAGYLGIPPISAKMRILTPTSTFPFYIFQFLVAVISLPFIYQVLRKSLKLSTLTLAFVIYFSAIFAFSRIIQTSYLAFLSQMLLLASFIDKTDQVKVGK